MKVGILCKKYSLFFSMFWQGLLEIILSIFLKPMYMSNVCGGQLKQKCLIMLLKAKSLTFNHTKEPMKYRLFLIPSN